MKKHLLVTVAIAMALSLLISFLPGGRALAVSTPGVVTRRALIIGNADYAQSPLTGPVYDAKHMEALFKQMDFGTGGTPAEQGAMLPTNIKRLNDQTKSQILKDISTYLAAKADSDDVSYFYYSGHGSISDGEAQLVGVDLSMISLTELKAALDNVPGTKVIILDSCFSGGFIDKAAAAADAGQGSTGKSRVLVLPGHNRTGTVAPTRSSGLKKAVKPGVTSAGLFPTALRQKPPDAAESLSGQFNGSVSATFAKTSKYLSGGKYIVLTAATQKEYSYEFGFNTMYGPNFIMNGADIAEPGSADSGEFTGMLIAGAGKVTFTPVYGEIGLLADYNGDNRISGAELEHFLKGAMICSDVALYTSSEDTGSGPSPDTAIFSHASPEANALRVKLTDGVADVKSASNATNIRVSLDLSGLSADYAKKLVVYKYPKVTDGTGTNGEIFENEVRTLNISNPASVSWDGKDDKGVAVSDGTYQIMLECGEGRVQPDDPPILYPGVTVVLSRGVSEFNSSNKVTLAKAGSSYAATGNVSIDTDGKIGYVWFTAPATGAMNVYANTAKLSATQTVNCELDDTEGNIVDYVSTSPMMPLIYMPFYVESGKEYRMKFSIDDNTDKSGDVGNFTYSLRLNTTISADKPVTGAGLDFEVWYVQPGNSQNYTVRGYGAADTAAVILDRNQTESIGQNDDYNDKHFLISAPLVKGAGYLILVKDFDTGSANQAFSFEVHSGALTAFDSSKATLITDSGMGYHAKVIDQNKLAATKYFKIVVAPGTDMEKWTFLTTESDDQAKLSMENDPFLMLMDQNYNLIGSNDDYNGSYAAEFSVVLQQKTTATTYILACRGLWSMPYDYDMLAFKQVIGASAYVLTMPKAVFMDNSALSLDRYGTISAWGYNNYGELGLGTADPSPTPSVVILPGIYGKAVNVWGGDVVGFARLTDGHSDTEYCWWGTSFSSIPGPGDGDGEPYPNTAAPTVLESLEGMDIADMKYGSYDYALVRTYTGELYLLDMLNDQISQVDLPGEGAHSVAGIATSDFSYFVLCNDGKLFSWGDNWSGECGTGDWGPVEAPTQVNFGSGVKITQVAAGWDHVLALDTKGNVYAWGDNEKGQLGQGASYTLNHEQAYKPVKIANSNFAGAVTEIYTGANHSFCIDAAGKVYGWGFNALAELGLGNAAKTPSPAVIPFYTSLGKGKIVKLSAGMINVFAQTYMNNIYGYGGNIDYQLGYNGQAPAGGQPIKLMTLKGAVAGHSSALKKLHVSSGTVVVNNQTKTITVKLGEKTSYCVVMPEAQDYDATCSVKANGVAVSNVITIPLTGGSKTVQIVISHPAGAGMPGTTTYTLTVNRDKSTDASLGSIGLTSGAELSPYFSSSTTGYTVTLPETMASVAVTPVAHGYGAHYVIDGVADKGKVFSLAVNGTMYSTVKVTAQAGNTKIYNITVRRPYILSSLSASPVASGYPSLSPGGTDRMKINYTLSLKTAVMIEVLKGGKWYSTGTDQYGAAETNTWLWDGKVAGATLAAGSYSVRVTPIYGEKACTAKTLTVKILPKPAVSIPSLSPTTLKANGTNKLTFKVKWTELCDVKVEIVNSSGTVVATVFSSADQAPTTKTLYWNGKNAKAVLVPAGTYRVKVTAGGATVLYKSFKVTR